MTYSGYTVNMEWISPLNRIILLYPEPRLVILNVRHNHSGEYFKLSDIPEKLQEYIVSEVHCENIEEFISGVPAATDIEGFVLELCSGQRIKIKTLEYLRKHKCKESIDNIKTLIENILYETIDDVKSLFNNNEFILNRIHSIENIVVPKYNHIENTVINFYNKNKLLNRKDYAILGQKELGSLFNLAMAMYLYGTADFKEFCIKRYKDIFEIKEDK